MNQQVISLLEKDKISHVLVDLTKSSPAVQLKAILRGVKTPTIMSNEKKIVDVENVKQAPKEMREQDENEV